MSDKEKVAHEIPGIMQAASQHLVKMAEVNVELVQRAEAAEHELRLTKLARRMDIRGIQPDLTFEEKVSALQDIPLEKLSTMEAAVEMAAGGVRFAKVAETENNKTSGYSPEGTRSDELDSFIENQTALT